MTEKILQLVAEFLFHQVAGFLLHLLPQFAFRQGPDVRPHSRAGHRASDRQRHFHRAERIETAACGRVGRRQLVDRGDQLVVDRLGDGIQSTLAVDFEKVRFHLQVIDSQHPFIEAAIHL